MGRMNFIKLISVFILTSCAYLPVREAPKFHYKYYVIAPHAYLGPTPEDDLASDVCEKQGDCIMMLRDEFYLLKADFKKSRVEVIDSSER